MIRFITRWCALGFMVCAVVPPAGAQVPARKPLQATSHVASAPKGEIRGLVEDDKGEPLAGAVVSALGATTTLAVADAEGRFVLRNLTPGTYLLRAHLQGYAPVKSRAIQASTTERSEYVLSLIRTAAA